MTDLEIALAAGAAALIAATPLINKWVKSTDTLVDDSLWAFLKRMLGRGK